MRKYIYIIIALLSIGTYSPAQTAKQTIVDGVSVGDVAIERNGKYIVIDMLLDINDLDVDGNRAVLLTPRLVNGKDSANLQSVGIYGRRRYYYYVRNGESMLSGKDEMTYRASQKPNEIAYHYILPYTDWMNGSTLALYRGDYGCCNSLINEQIGVLGCHVEKFFPELVYVRPVGDSIKVRSLEGSAYIDFPVDQTIIYPDYRRNTVELGKIKATIDSVREDKDITITSVWLKGFASPESPYSHNTDLAIGRTAALKKHIGQLYNFNDTIISTDYEPENWAGLRKYVEESSLEHRNEILALIDSDMQPDPKEAKIKRTYPKEYRFLLQNCYPALRRTDYRIEYTIRTFIDVEEIKHVLIESPQKLSLNEFYLVAQEYEPGTFEFSNVFETAVRMFPKDTIANLNAANAAIRREDYKGAERYLLKSGTSPEATYARAALAIRLEEYDKAKELLQKAKDAGLKQAEVTLEQLEKGRR